MGLYEKSAAAMPKAIVLRCTECGSMYQTVTGQVAGFLASGWPTCCGYTMRVEDDPPPAPKAPPALPAELSGKGEQPVTSKELDELGREGSGMALLRVLPRLLASARREQRARALLKRIEWSGNLGQNSYGCAECDFEERSGHAPGCELAALIAGEPGEAKKEEGGRHGR